jgi:hypothetical protein
MEEFFESPLVVGEVCALLEHGNWEIAFWKIWKMNGLEIGD